MLTKKVNEELISLYWDFGKYISEKVKDSNWGDRIVDKLVDFMKREYPTMKGFNRAGIYRMKQFYETYKDNEIVAPLVRQISWSHNVIILGSTNSIEEKEFYIKMCIKNNYSKRELDRQIGSGYYQRYMLSNGKANQSLVTRENYRNKGYAKTLLKSLCGNYKQKYDRMLACIHPSGYAGTWYIENGKLYMDVDFPTIASNKEKTLYYETFEKTEKKKIEVLVVEKGLIFSSKFFEKI